MTGTVGIRPLNLLLAKLLRKKVIMEIGPVFESGSRRARFLDSAEKEKKKDQAYK